MATERLFSRPVSRTFAATLGVLLTAVLATTAMPSYLPIGEANRVVMPIVLFPVTWLLLFLWVLFESKLWRAWTGLIVIAGGSLALTLTQVGVI